MLTLTYDGSLVSVANSSPNIDRQIATQLTYTNLSILYENKSKGTALESTFCLYANHCFPTGLLTRVCRLLDKENIKFSLIDLNPNLPAQPISFPHYLRDYQVEAIGKAIQERRGILEMVTGGGKTLTAVWYIKSFPNANVLITVPTIDLLNQTRDTLAEHFDEPIGKVGASNYTWERITVGLINSLTLAATQNSAELKKFQIVIHDEAHFAGSNSYLTLACKLTSVVRAIGLSATPKRTDGADLVVEGVIGEIIYQVAPSKVASTGAILMPEYYQLSLPSRYLVEKRRAPIISSTPTNQEMLRLYKYAITNNHARTRTTVDIAISLFKNPARLGTILILFDYRDHGNLLQLEFKKRGLEVELVDGTTKAKERAAIVERFKDRKIEILLGSSIFKQGVDFPEVEFLILTGSRSSSATHWQQLGRALRGNASYKKRRSVIVDFRDGDYFFNRRAQRRYEAVESKYGKASCRVVNSIDELFERIDF
jgi:superfamily II DNA or RNA helicase